MSKVYKLIKAYPNSPKINTIIKYVEENEDMDAPFEGYIDGKDNVYDSPELYPEFWEEVIEKDYEILSFVNDNGDIFTIPEDGLAYHESWNPNERDGINFSTCCLLLYIHSIKRLSDGEVFSIGDVLNFNNIGIGKLLRIDFERAPADKGKGILCFVNDNPSLGDWWTIDKLEKVEIKERLFTTEDGIGVKAGNFVWITNGEYISQVTVPSSLNLFRGKTGAEFKYYSSESAAKNSIKKYSLKQVIDALHYLGTNGQQKNTVIKFLEKL